MAAKSSPVAAPKAASGCPPERESRALASRAGGGVNACFPPAARILTSAGFERVFKHGRRTAVPVMAVHVLTGGDSARLGLVVSRKVDKRAVQRNRIKRVIRESFRQRRAALAPGDYVVLARIGAADFDNAKLRQTFERLLARARVLQSPPL